MMSTLSAKPCREHGTKCNWLQNGQRIDPKGTLDVTPYADATFQYFLRNPVCQEMGEKVSKMAFLIF